MTAAPSDSLVTTCNANPGFCNPIPILLPDWNITELEIVLDELNNAILLIVPGPTGAKEAVVANEAVPDSEPDIDPVSPPPIKLIPLPEMSSDPVITALPENGNPAPLAAFNANDAVNAWDADTAHDDVPKNDPE